MRITEYYNLNRTQPSIDFVDIDIENDVLVFIDPRALRLLPSTWGDVCVSLIQDFFRHILQLIRSEKHDVAQRLLQALREPNETHLGYSRRRSRGRALGPDSARDVWEALSRSEAVQTGLLEDLEDTILMVPGIDADIVSDIATNVIREPLIRYTQEAAHYYGIPLHADVDSSPLWDSAGHSWHSEFAELPVAQGNKLLLVPKVIVRRRMSYDLEEYYRHYLLPELQEAEIRAGTELVHLLRDGRPKVTKKDLIAKYGHDKEAIVRQTLRHPLALQRYRNDKSEEISPPLTHLQIADSAGSEAPNWNGLLTAVTEIRPGREQADEYERAIECLLTAILYPSLSNPQVQFRIHEGRKRVDITYTNVAQSGFYYWLALNYPAAHIFVECKNYIGEVGNPELDQLAGRFSPSRGQVGLLVCRSIDDKGLFTQRCRDTAQDHRGFIIPLDDLDLKRLVSQRRDELNGHDFPMLLELFERLIM